jgi:hypothetical protein
MATDGKSQSQKSADFIEDRKRLALPEKGQWWTGLDSNQRTETRADLQSAAFNHSATCPVPYAVEICCPAALEAAQWRMEACLSMG